MTKTVLVIDKFADVYKRELEERFPSLDVHTAKAEADVRVALDRVDIMISFGNGLTNDLYARMTRLAWVQSLATGTDQFLRNPAFRKETIITSARGLHDAPMRETVLHLMLGISRDVTRLVHDKDARRWDRGQPWPILAGKTAVIVGVGVSGIGIARALKALGMTTIGITRTVREIDGFDEVLPDGGLVTAAARADFLIGVLPGGASNAGRIGREVIGAMKPTAYFINVGRGETVDEATLVEALAGKRIAGAGLDVVRVTPLPQDSPIWSLPNVFLSPHIGGFFAEYEAHVMPLLTRNMEAFLAGRTGEMVNVVAHWPVGRR